MTYLAHHFPLPMKQKSHLLRQIILFVGILGLWLTVTPITLAAPVSPCPESMVPIEGGTFTMGDEQSNFVEEQVVKDIIIDSFCMDQYEVTNAEFTNFVAETGYITLAEQILSEEQFPDLTADQRVPGSIVFQMPAEGTKQVGHLSWWQWTPGANWQHPFGPNSDLQGKANYPVVQIAYEDAVAYAQWANKSLPTEAQWEYAARGGLDQATYSWGNQYSAKKANTWQGLFPFFNTKEDGYIGTAPVGSFAANGYSLYDITGNVWEWTSDWYQINREGNAHSHNPTGADQAESFDPRKTDDGALHVIKGGSYLCAKNYCSRYRPAARESQSPDTGTTHIGFRLVQNL